MTFCIQNIIRKQRIDMIEIKVVIVVYKYVHVAQIHIKIKHNT